MIKLIVGLGNPGSKYQKTRHNIGFLFLDYLTSEFGVSWLNEPKFHGFVATVFIANSKIIVLKPQIFMNRSGLSVGSIAKFYKINVDEVLVVHDELDLAEGVVKLKLAGGHAGHNGLRDIIAQLGSRNFYRIRIGIDRPIAGKKVADYVLSNLSKEAWGLMGQSFDLLLSQLDSIVKGDIATAMNIINKK